MENEIRTAMRETMIDLRTACRNVQGYNPSCDLSILPDRPLNKVSIYFIGILITKVCSPVCFILRFIFFQVLTIFKTMGVIINNFSTGGGRRMQEKHERLCAADCHYLHSHVLI